VIVSILVAVAENGVIGVQGRLPWHLPLDLKRFKHLTVGHPMIMGRKTWESIGKPLPGRTSIVVTRNPGYVAAGAFVATSLEAALAACARDSEAFVIGGEAVYADALPRAHRLYLTRVHAEVEGDAYFPNVDWEEWMLVGEERYEADPRHAFAFTFLDYQRVG
jgi:dihydrofolate reductase